MRDITTGLIRLMFIQSSFIIKMICSEPSIVNLKTFPNCKINIDDKTNAEIDNMNYCCEF